MKVISFIIKCIFSFVLLSFLAQPAMAYVPDCQEKYSGVEGTAYTTVGNFNFSYKFFDGTMVAASGTITMTDGRVLDLEPLKYGLILGIYPINGRLYLVMKGAILEYRDGVLEPLLLIDKGLHMVISNGGCHVIDEENECRGHPAFDTKKRSWFIEWNEKGPVRPVSTGTAGKTKK